MTDEKRERGWALLQSIHNVVADKTVGSLSEVAPDLAEMIVTFAYGEIMARPGLDVKTRQLCTVAMLASMGGHTAPELKAHIRGALQVGWTKGEIAEVLIQTAVYAGFPAAINAAGVAKTVFAAWDEEHPASEEKENTA
jgi:4-carboxymuconolactone decarboxylase